MTNPYHIPSLATGPTDWGAVFSWGDEKEDGPPGAPKRAGSNVTSAGDIFDHWFKDSGRVVSASDPVLSRLSTDWTKDLARWTLEAERMEWRNVLVLKLSLASMELDELSRRLAETSVGRILYKRRKTAEMNARYVYRGGERKYVGKRIVNARKAKRADAARDRRTREWVESHAVDLPTNVRLIQ